MHIEAIEVKLKEGGIEEHKGAIGQQVDSCGALQVLYAVNEPNPQTGEIGKRPYVAVMYAPGTWEKTMVQGAQGDQVIPVKNKLAFVR